MIITVTMNPAIDKTIDLDCFIHGGLNRIHRIEQDAGGKGINVSKTIQKLGGTSTATGFLAGNAGDMIEKTMKEYGIKTDFIRIEGETRTNTKIVEKKGIVTELNEPGPCVSGNDIRLLFDKLDQYAAPGVLVILSGSVPASVDKSIYRTITERMHAKGASVLLDADGELFVRALVAKPDIIKPNLAELEGYINCMHPHSADGSSQNTDGVSYSGTAVSQNADGLPQTVIPSLQSLTDSGQELLRSGISSVIISLGGDGALFLDRNHACFCPALSVRTHSTVGAGDAMVAALALGWEKKLSFEECASLAMAASAGAVTTTGTKPPSRETVDSLLSQVRLFHLSE